MRKAIVLAAMLALNAGVAIADDKPNPQTITLNYCVKVETIVMMGNRATVICTGDGKIAPHPTWPTMTLRPGANVGITSDWTCTQTERQMTCFTRND